MKLKQIVISIENSPGRLLEVADALGKAGINLRALNLVDTGAFGQLRLLVSDVVRARQILMEMHISAFVNEVVAAEIDDAPGSLANLLRPLRDANINVIYMYAFIGSTAGKRPVHILVDSTGLKIHVGNLRKPPKNRDGRKLHVVVNALTGEIIACDATSTSARDASRVPALLKQIDGQLASVRADGAYDKETVYQAVETSPMFYLAALDRTWGPHGHSLSEGAHPGQEECAGAAEGGRLAEAQPKHPVTSQTGRAAVAHPVRLQQAEPGRGHNLPLQDPHRSGDAEP